MNHFSSLACKLLSKIEDDYNLAKKISINIFIAHWNVFEESKFNKLLKLPIVGKILRNSISIGFNDSMVSISNKRFATGNNNNYWNNLKSNYSEILENF